MPNIGTLLKQEISRICRREIRKEIEGTRKASAAHRRDIAALKREIATLRRDTSALSKRASSSAQEPAASAERPMRFVAKGLRSLRARLGLSQSQLALLVGVSDQSVYNWEGKKATPRKEQLAAIAALRGLGKREAQQRLADLRPKKKAGRRKK
jgi:DNA-binding transcriptional regulator YiaG